MLDKAKYYSFLNIFLQPPSTLSSCPTYSASTLSRFLSSSNFNPMPLIGNLIFSLLYKLTPLNNTAFLIADTTLLRKTGSKIEGVKKLYDPSLKKTVLAHKALVISLSLQGFRIPLYVELLIDKKPVDALIEILKKLLPFLREFFPKLIFLCDAGFTCNKLLNFLLSQRIDFVCAISQGRVDEETGYKLKELWFPKPEKIKLKGVDTHLYAYRIGEGTDKERVVVSNKWLTVKKFKSYYRIRWDIECEIRTMKSIGLEDYMVRRLKAIKLWIMAVWHVRLIKLKAKLNGIDFKKFLLSFVMPNAYLLILDLLKFLELLIRRSLRFSPFPDDKLILFLLQDFIKNHSPFAKV